MRYYVETKYNDIPMCLIEDSATGFDWSVGGRHRSVFDYCRAKDLARLHGGWIKPLICENEVVI